MKNKTPYAKAAEAARRASLGIDEADYKGFYEISDGGVLACSEHRGELRLAPDTDGESAPPRDIREVRRSYITLDASCLNTDDDGRVCVKIKK